MLLSIARRSVRILPQVRMLRFKPAESGALPPINEGRGRGQFDHSETRDLPPIHGGSQGSSRRRRKNAEGLDDDEEVIVGQTVEQVFKKFPNRIKKNLLEDPSLVTLVQQHRVDVNAEPKVGYTQDELAAFDKMEEIKIDDALRDFRESSFDADFLDSVGPGFQPTYNVAALADEHEVIRNLIAMNVPVHKWDSEPAIFRKMVELSWHKDCVPKLEYLVKECSLEATDLPKVLGRNPTVLAEKMQHLEARIEYLRDKKVGLGLKSEELRRLVRTESKWLSHPVEAIENRINFFQNHFHLHKTEFKRLIVSRPQVLLMELRKVALKRFSMIEEMGFTDAQIRRAIRLAPKILSVSRLDLVDRFQVLHLDMGFDHNIIASNARALYCRTPRLKERHAFLKKLGRDQYDHLKPGYISPLKVVGASDQEFVEKVANSTKEAFENFIKSM